jgi:hypothetical protein
VALGMVTAWIVLGGILVILILLVLVAPRFVGVHEL